MNISTQQNTSFVLARNREVHIKDQFNTGQYPAGQETLTHQKEITNDDLFLLVQKHPWLLERYSWMKDMYPHFYKLDHRHSNDVITFH